MGRNIWRASREEPLGRPRYRWKNNIRVDLRDRRWEGVDWLNLAQHKDQ
jgi:hypothetical protein